MDPISIITAHPEILWVAIALGTVTEAIGRAGGALDLGRTRAWSFAMTIIPMLLGAAAGAFGALPGDSWASRVAMGIATAWPVMAGWKLQHEARAVVRRPPPGPDEVVQ